MYIYESLSRDNYLVMNKTMIKLFGINEALFISELFYRRNWCVQNNKLTEDGFFYATVKDIEEQTTLSEYQQTKILSSLEQLNLIITERRGLPAKRYIMINAEAFQKYLDEGVCTDPEKLSNNNLSNSVLINNNINNKDSSASKDTDESRAGSKAPATSGKLINKSSKSTKKQITQKINQFITRNQREIISRDYPPELVKILDCYFRMLAESNTLLPLESIKYQLNELEKLPGTQRVQAVRETVGHGWKSLQYVIDQLKDKDLPDFDTARNANHQLKTEQEKMIDLVKEAEKRGDEIF